MPATPALEAGGASLGEPDDKEYGTASRRRDPRPPRRRRGPPARLPLVGGAAHHDDRVADPHLRVAVLPSDARTA